MFAFTYLETQRVHDSDKNSIRPSGRMSNKRVLWPTII